LCDHGLVHVLLVEGLVFCASLVRLHFLVGHDDKFGGGNFAGEDALAELGVGFVLEVLKQGAHLGLVGFVYGAGVCVGGGLDLFCDAKDFIGRWLVIREAVLGLGGTVTVRTGFTHKG